MAGRYGKALEGLAKANLVPYGLPATIKDPGGATISRVDYLNLEMRIVACTSGYTANFDTDAKFVLGDIDPPLGFLPPADIVGQSSALTGKIVTLGRLNADDVLFTGLPAAKTITQFIVAVCGLDPTGTLDPGVGTMYYLPQALITLDTNDVAISYPTGSGGDLSVRWENVAPFIFEV